MGILSNIRNGVIDIVKLAIIALVCLVVVFIGGYMMADYVGLIPEATGYYRPLSLQTFLTDLPFIGSNMIYLIIAMALLLLVVIAIEIYCRKRNVESNADQQMPAGTDGAKTEIPAEPAAPEIKK